MKTEPNALDFLDQLVERSLVTTELDGEERRFRMLETVREYATEQLTPEQREAVETLAEASTESPRRHLGV